MDIVAVLTDSADPNNYWKVLKNRLKKEGSRRGDQVSCSHLPSCREAVLVFPFRPLLVLRKAVLASSAEKNQNIFSVAHLCARIIMLFEFDRSTGQQHYFCL